MKLFYVQFLLTKKCNKNCYYCDLNKSNKNYNNKFEVDLDYFEWCIKTLSMYSNNLFVELSGGEIGLISNIDDFILLLKSYKSVKKIQLMSNGLLRYNHPTIIDLVDVYNEHLVYKIDGKSIIKFYNMDFMNSINSKNIIVLDEVTTKSLLNNYDYFDYIGIFNENNFWLKMYVERESINNHKNDIIKLFSHIKTSYANHCINQLQKYNKLKQKMCSMYPWMPVIDLDDKVIIHCAYHNFSNRIYFDCTEYNLGLLINRRLFRLSNPQYCSLLI